MGIGVLEMTVAVDLLHRCEYLLVCSRRFLILLVLLVVLVPGTRYALVHEHRVEVHDTSSCLSVPTGWDTLDGKISTGEFLLVCFQCNFYFLSNSPPAH